MSSASSKKTTVKLSGTLCQYRFTGNGRQYILKNWRLTTRHRPASTGGSSASPSSTVTVLKSTSGNMPDEMTILFTPYGLQPFIRTNGNAFLTKASARREKHDVWGSNYTLVNDSGETLFSAETIHLVTHIDKIQAKSVEISIT